MHLEACEHSNSIAGGEVVGLTRDRTGEHLPRDGQELTLANLVDRTVRVGSGENNAQRSTLRQPNEDTAARGSRAKWVRG